MILTRYELRDWIVLAAEPSDLSFARHVEVDSEP
jgi:hypothetical protein